MHGIVPTSWLFALCAALLLLLVGIEPSYAAFKGAVEIETTGPRVVSTAPGQVMTTAFRIKNDALTPRTFTAYVETPQHWQLVIPQPAIVVPAQSAVTRLLSVLVPQNTEVGQYAIHFLVQAQDDPDIHDASTVVVSTSPRYAVEAHFTDVVALPRPGTPYVAYLDVTNQGNLVVDVHLEVQSSHGYAATLPAATYRMATQETRRVPITVMLPTDIPSSLWHRLHVRVGVVGQPEVVVQTKTRTRVEVVRETPTPGIPSRTFPMRATIGPVGNDDTNGLQYELAGSGSPAFGRNATADFLIRLPDRRRHSVFAGRDVYRLSYSEERFALRLGDHFYSLSPLSEGGQLGLGAGGEAQVGRFTLGGYYQQSRQRLVAETQRAGFIGYQLGTAGVLSVNMLDKRGSYSGETLTLRGQFSPGNHTQLDLEWGGGRSNGKTRQAYALNLAGRRPWVSYAVQVLHAGRGYTGSYRDRDLRHISTTLRPLPWLYFSGALRDHRRRYEATSLAPRTSRVTRTARLEAKVSGKVKTYPAFLRLTYKNIDERLLQPSLVAHRADASFEIGGGYHYHRLRLEGDIVLGANRAALTGASGRYREYKVSTSFVTPRLSYTTSASYLTGTLYAGTRSQQRWRVNAGINALLLKRTRAAVQFFTLADKRSRRYTSTSALARVEHTFAFGHELSMQGRYHVFGKGFSQGSTEYAIGYTVPINVPMRSGPDFSSVKGRVVDGETGKGVANVMLNLGGQMLRTESDGRFSFSSLTPGTYYLSLDPLSTGLDRVPMRDMPAKVTVGVVRSAPIEIALTRSAQVSGRVVRYDFPTTSRTDGSGAAIAETGGMRGMVVELKDGVGRVRTTTDAQGRFALRDLRPGVWELRVVSGAVPTYHAVEQEVYTLRVAPGGETTVQVKVVPKRRKIQYVQPGTQGQR